MLVKYNVFSGDEAVKAASRNKAMNVRTVEKEKNVNRHHQTITWLTLMHISGKRASNPSIFYF